jgi:hypothetical protein
MDTRPKPKRSPLRWTALVVLCVALAYVGLEMALLVVEPAPYNQGYGRATDAQNASVTRRLALAVFAAPLLTVLTIYAVFPAKTFSTSSGLPKLIGAILLLSAFGSCAVGFSLPYGFGSGYEHASAAQHTHLNLTANGGILHLVLGLVLLFIGFLGSGRKRDVG